MYLAASSSLKLNILSYAQSKPSWRDYIPTASDKELFSALLTIKRALGLSAGLFHWFQRKNLF